MLTPRGHLSQSTSSRHDRLSNESPSLAYHVELDQRDWVQELTNLLPLDEWTILEVAMIARAGDDWPPFNAISLILLMGSRAHPCS